MDMIDVNMSSILCIVFCYLKRNKISATIFGKSLAGKYMNKLKEEKCYIIQNFIVKHNSNKFKVVDHPYKINFHSNTSVYPCEAFIPLRSFNFVSFKDILAGKVSETILIGTNEQIQILYFFQNVIFYIYILKLMSLYLYNYVN